MDESDLGRLPPELRLMIYGFFLQDPMVLVDKPPSVENSWYTGLALAHTCVTLYHDIMPVLFSKDRLVLVSFSHTRPISVVNFVRHFIRARTWLVAFERHTPLVKEISIFGGQLHYCPFHPMVFFQQLKNATRSLERCREEVDLMKTMTKASLKIGFLMDWNLSKDNNDDHEANIAFRWDIDLRAQKTGDNFDRKSVGRPADEIARARTRFNAYKREAIPVVGILRGYDQA